MRGASCSNVSVQNIRSVSTVALTELQTAHSEVFFFFTQRSRKLT
jgi:hypothetical protein